MKNSSFDTNKRLTSTQYQVQIKSKSKIPFVKIGGYIVLCLLVAVNVFIFSSSRDHISHFINQNLKDPALKAQEIKPFAPIPTELEAKFSQPPITEEPNTIEKQNNPSDQRENTLSKDIQDKENSSTQNETQNKNQNYLANDNVADDDSENKKMAKSAESTLTNIQEQKESEPSQKSGISDESKTYQTQTVFGIMKSGQTLADALSPYGVDANQYQELVFALKGKFDFSSLRPGERFAVSLSANKKINFFEYQSNAEKLIRLERTLSHEFKVEILTPHIETKVENVYGTIKSSLYDAVDELGEGYTLVHMFANIFAWDIDFYSEVRSGDQFKVVVEKRYLNGQFISYGKILAAQYQRVSNVTHSAFRFGTDENSESYYDAFGRSLKKSFLLSPIEFAHITSKFGMRYHPVLKRTRSHKGIDYGAAAGTPIQAVADGKVTQAGPNGGYGNMVAIKHSNGFESRYAHLSRIPNGVYVGKSVKQQSVIGYVGSTGLATGPHLHYELLKGSQHVNPLKQKFHQGQSISKSQLAVFKKSVDQLKKHFDFMTDTLAKLSISKSLLPASSLPDPKTL